MADSPNAVGGAAVDVLDEGFGEQARLARDGDLPGSPERRLHLR